MNLQTINDVLHKHGMRVTPQRIWIYNYLVENKTHPDAESLYCMLLNDGCYGLQCFAKVFKMRTYIGGQDRCCSHKI